MSFSWFFNPQMRTSSRPWCVKRDGQVLRMDARQEGIKVFRRTNFKTDAIIYNRFQILDNLALLLHWIKLFCSFSSG